MALTKVTSPMIDGVDSNNNTLFGENTSPNLTTGDYNTVVGQDAGEILTTGASNTLVGASAGRNITTGARNVFLGINGGSGNAVLSPVVPLTGSNNIGVGFHAIKKCQTGSQNIGVGVDAGNEITTGNDNTCLGGSAGQQVTIGSDNTLVGRSAALRLGTDASANPADPATWIPVGGTGNTVMGRDALRNAYDCDSNTVIGYGAMRGTQSETSLTGNITGDFNIAIGYRATYTNPTTLANNVVVGGEAGKELSTGSNNVMIGHQAGRDIEGSGNVIIGALAARSVPTASNRFVVANQSSTAFLDGDMVGAVDASNILRIDALTRPATDNFRSLGSGLFRWSVVFAATGTINTSDERAKQDIDQLDEVEQRVAVRLKKLVKKYRFKEAVEQKGADARIHVGVIAQEVKLAFEAEGLDAHKYGLLCYDEWADEFEPITKEEEVTVTLDNGETETFTRFVDTGEKKLVRLAGNRYGVRYEELFAFIISAL